MKVLYRSRYLFVPLNAAVGLVNLPVETINLVGWSAIKSSVDTVPASLAVWLLLQGYLPTTGLAGLGRYHGNR